MSMIRVKNLTFGYEGSYENVFENVNFQMDTDWKLGFTAVSYTHLEGIKGGMAADAALSGELDPGGGDLSHRRFVNVRRGGAACLLLRILS